MHVYFLYKRYNSMIIKQLSLPHMKLVLARTVLIDIIFLHVVRHFSVHHVHLLFPGLGFRCYVIFVGLTG